MLGSCRGQSDHVEVFQCKASNPEGSQVHATLPPCNVHTTQPFRNPISINSLTHSFTAMATQLLHFWIKSGAWVNSLAQAQHESKNVSMLTAHGDDDDDDMVKYADGSSVVVVATAVARRWIVGPLGMVTGIALKGNNTVYGNWDSSERK